jgi:hypothetical protein
MLNKTFLLSILFLSNSAFALENPVAGAAAAGQAMENVEKVQDAVKAGEALTNKLSTPEPAVQTEAPAATTTAPVEKAVEPATTAPVATTEDAKPAKGKGKHKKSHKKH